MTAQERIASVCSGLPGTAWSVRILNGDHFEAEVDADRVLRIASMGKLLVLMAAAERIARDPVFATHLLARPEQPVADSGLWQHLATPTLSVADACVLVGSVSDNLATNALIDEIGLQACNDVASQIGCQAFVLHDIVRDVRGPSDPPCLAEGSAHAVTELLRCIDDPTMPWGRVREWLALGADHSMAIAALAADPLSQGAAGEPPHAHKTGSDPGVRADAGLIGAPGAALAYAVIVNFDPLLHQPSTVQQAMRTVLDIALRH